MYKRNNIVIGLIFVVLGAIFLLKNLNIFSFYFNIFDIGFLISRFWPALFLILPSVFIHTSYFSGRRRDPGILVPAGVLATSGVIFQISILFGLNNVFLWPGLLLAVAVGLFELYVFGTRDKGLLIPVTILSGLSAIFFINITFKSVFHFYNTSKLIMPVILILLGVIIILRNKHSSN